MIAVAAALALAASPSPSDARAGFSACLRTAIEQSVRLGRTPGDFMVLARRTCARQEARYRMAATAGWRKRGAPPRDAAMKAAGEINDDYAESVSRFSFAVRSARPRR